MPPSPRLRSRSRYACRPPTSRSARTRRPFSRSRLRLARPRRDFDLAADRIDVVELQKLVPEPSGKAASKPAANDSMLLRTTGTGQLRVGTIVHEQLTLEDVQTTVTLDRGVIRLDPLTAGLYGGRHRGTVTMDTRRTPTSFAIA